MDNTQKSAENNIAELSKYLSGAYQIGFVISCTICVISFSKESVDTIESMIKNVCEDAAMDFAKGFETIAKAANPQTEPSPFEKTYAKKQGFERGYSDGIVSISFAAKHGVIKEAAVSVRNGTDLATKLAPVALRRAIGLFLRDEKSRERLEFMVNYYVTDCL